MLALAAGGWQLESDTAACGAGSLRDVMQSVSERVASGYAAPDAYFVCVVLHVFRQACCALASLQRESFLHRDLKPDNILLNLATSCLEHNSGRLVGGDLRLADVKVGDLGSAKNLSDTSACLGYYAARNYSAPEVLHPAHRPDAAALAKQGDGHLHLVDDAPGELSTDADWMALCFGMLELCCAMPAHSLGVARTKGCAYGHSWVRMSK